MLNPGTVLGNYEILSTLGRGGMGEVYLARDLRLSREVALKVLPQAVAHETARLERFQQEARVISALNHPNIVTIFELGESDRGWFIIMERVEGHTLADWAGQTRSLREWAEIGRQVAEALAVAHGAGVVHRDIKPENVMVRTDGYVKVLDFGIARLTAEDGDDETRAGLTAPGAFVGTLRYLAPEQVTGAAAPASDVFALGIVLYELATGRHPFGDAQAWDYLSALATGTVTKPSTFNPELPDQAQDLLLRMLDRDARQRPSTVEVAETLAVLASGVPLARAPIAASTAPRRAGPAVGRDRERQTLAELFADVSRGRGQLVSIAGDPGMGKTTLVELFLEDIGPGPFVGRGRTSERLAGTEAYLPLLEALEELARAPDGGTAAGLMKTFAPTWYAHVVSTGSTTSGDLQAAQAVSQERLKRELLNFFQELAGRQPVVLFLDDIHWADVSTVDMLAYLATKFDSLRLLLLVGYRPSELKLAHHPFIQVQTELELRGLARELALDSLSRDEVERFLGRLFPGHALPDDVADVIHERTGGHPLFMADLVRYFTSSGVIRMDGGRWAVTEALAGLERDLPDSVRAMIERKLGQLSDADRRFMATASVQGHDFDSAVLADVLKIDPADVEEQLEVMENVHGLVRMQEERTLPDGTFTLRYRFVHGLYQNALQASLRPTRRASLSRAVAEALVRFHGGGSAALASDLAYLFASARDPERAAHHFRVAAQQAAGIFAHGEAVALAERGLAQIAGRPESPERLALELALQLTFAFSVTVTKGYSADAAASGFRRAMELSGQVEHSPETFAALWGLWLYHLGSADFSTATGLAEQMVERADRSGAPELVTGAHGALGYMRQLLGDPTAGRQHFEQAAKAYDRSSGRSFVALYRFDAGAWVLAELSRSRWLTGDSAGGREAIDEALVQAKRIAEPRTLAVVHEFGCFFHQLCGDSQGVLDWAGPGIELCDEHEMPQERDWIAAVRGWALVRQGQAEAGLAELEASLAGMSGRGAAILLGYFLGLLAEARLTVGRVDDARQAAEQALEEVERTGDRHYEAELHRLRAETLRAGGDLEAAQAAAARALDVARGQGALALERRALATLEEIRRGS